jgi:hypothetical protein
MSVRRSSINAPVGRDDLPHVQHSGQVCIPHIIHEIETAPGGPSRQKSGCECVQVGADQDETAQGIARTLPEYEEQSQVSEIEAAKLAMIAAARKYILHRKPVLRVPCDRGSDRRAFARAGRAR